MAPRGSDCRDHAQRLGPGTLSNGQPRIRRIRRAQRLYGGSHGRKGNCWLEVVEECKRLKREKGTHKKVRDPKALGRKAATELYRALRLFKIANGPWLTRVLSIGYVLIQPFLAPPSHGWAPWAGSSALKLGSRLHSQPQHLILRHLLF